MTWAHFVLRLALSRFHPYVWCLFGLERPLLPSGRFGKKTAAIFWRKMGYLGNDARWRKISWEFVVLNDEVHLNMPVRCNNDIWLGGFIDFSETKNLRRKTLILREL